MSTPLCFRTLELGWDGPTAVTTGGPCLGSRCAAWTNAQMQPGHGYCGLGHASQMFLDPSRPTTRQTTPKPKSTEKTT